LYHVISAPGHGPGATSTEAGHGHDRLALPSAQASTPSATPYAHETVVQLTAIEDCWVEFTMPGGGYLFQSYVVAGASKRWVFKRAVDMRLGSPGGVKLVVDGMNPMPPGTTRPVTLRLGLRGNSS